MKEHAEAVAILDKNSLLAKHHILHNHQIDLERVKIVDRSLAWQQRLILEAWPKRPIIQIFLAIVIYFKPFFDNFLE